MYEGQPRRIRNDDTWDEVRRAWEAGETGASLARRYDVGLANLWRRRASEGWTRRHGENDPAPEPVEGWDRFAQRKLGEFELRREEARALAQTLAAAMAGGEPDTVPLWDVGFVLAWRAERLGPETAAADRAWRARHDWAAEFWDGEGRLKRISRLDAVTLNAHRAAWREEAGLPEGKAEAWP